MIQRTTIAADRDDLETLRAEARRRRVSLARLLREIVAANAAEPRAARRPRLGLGRSGQGIAGDSVEDEDSPAHTPYQS